MITRQSIQAGGAGSPLRVWGDPLGWEHPQGKKGGPGGRSKPGEKVGDLHGGGYPVALFRLPALAECDEHSRVLVTFVGVVVVGEQNLLELALVGEEGLTGEGWDRVRGLG